MWIAETCCALLTMMVSIVNLVFIKNYLTLSFTEFVLVVPWRIEGGCKFGACPALDAGGIQLKTRLPKNSCGIKAITIYAMLTIPDSGLASLNFLLAFGLWKMLGCWLILPLFVNMFFI